MSSIRYSELNYDEGSSSRRPSSYATAQFIPESRTQRTLVFCALLTGSIITLFYMRHFYIHNNYQNQNHQNYNYQNQSQNFKELNYSSRVVDASTKSTPPENFSSKPSWSWVCQYDRCVRFQVPENWTPHSLKTCNMLCSDIPIWPKPTGYVKLSKTIVPIQIRGFTLSILKSPSTQVSHFLQEAFGLMLGDIHKEITKNNSNETTGVIVRVTVNSDADPKLRLNTKENYKLIITTEANLLTVNIKAESFCGARHGFETLSQLIWYDENFETIVAMKSASVEDNPSFKYRGLLLDTARHYFPVEDILRTLDAMAASKLNTFHWHATDSQSFPLQLNSFPQMAWYGAYSRKQVYTVEDIKTIVHKARLRGIRVVIEIDAPAHVGRAWSWGNTVGFEDLLYCLEEEPWHNFCGEPPCGQLNPKNDHVFEILEKIYREIIELTGVEDVFHLGGDEVNANCWSKSMNMKNDEITDTWFEFLQKTNLALARANNGTFPEVTIIWSSRLTGGTILQHMKNFTIQLWGGTKAREMKTIPDSGLRTIASHINAWYLDCGFGSWRDDSQGNCDPYRTWQLVYEHRPWKGTQWKVEGGTACMWSELVGPESLDPRLWPRVAALGERLWSDPMENVINETYLRIDMQRKRLVDRGIKAEPIWPRWCTENPYECLRK